MHSLGLLRANNPPDWADNPTMQGPVSEPIRCAANAHSKAYGCRGSGVKRIPKEADHPEEIPSQKRGRAPVVPRGWGTAASLALCCHGEFDLLWLEGTLAQFSFQFRSC